MSEIPSIDLDELNLQSKKIDAKKQVGQFIVDAFSKYGVIRLEGTGLGPKNKIFEDVQEAFQKIFRKSDEEKQKHLLNANLQAYFHFERFHGGYSRKPQSS